MSNFSEAISSGDYRTSLEALRDKVASDLGEVDGCHVAPLAKQLQDILAKLDTMKPAETSKVDDLAKRRAERLGAKVPKQAEKKVVGGTGSGRTGGKRGPVPGPVAKQGSRRRAK